jgi:tetratricopeptide (TPR) repeat protein
MIRCPACGVRLRDSAPRCPAHGPPPATDRPPAADADAAPPFVTAPPRLAGYTVHGLLGQGGMGAVFEARRDADGATVAVKVARADQPSAGARLALERDALAAIGPPVVPALLGAGQLDDGAAYAILELVRAPTLAACLADAAGPLPPDLFAPLARAIVAAVAAVHARGFIHCDLKPENIFVGPFGPGGAPGARLFDFGLVRPLRAAVDAAAAAGAPRSDAPEGTPEYMSPEQCDADAVVAAPSDVYALGVILYEMCCGAPPFWGNAAEVLQSHRSSRPPSLVRRAAVPPPLEDAVLRCLAKDPARRFAGAAELAQQLAAVLDAPAAVVAAAPEPARPPAPAAGDAVRPAAAAARPRPAAAARERRAVALCFFDTKTGIVAVRDGLASVGAHLAHAAGTLYVAAFGHEIGDNPTRSAALAAQMFIDRGWCSRVLVDLASVSIQARPDGGRRYQSPLFQRKEAFPAAGDPAGVMLAPAAADVLSDFASAPIPSRPGAALVLREDSGRELTSTRASVAPLIGREETLHALLDSARTATSGKRPTITTVIGEPGHGKSHLASVLVQHLESIMPPLEVIVLRAREALGGAGEQTTREIFRRVLGLPPAAPADLGRALLAGRLGADSARELWAGVAVAMGWTAPDHTEVRGLAAAPGALRSAAARAAGEGLRAQSRLRPLAIVIEDAHFVDETALDALEFAALEEAGCPIWVCVIGRPSFGRGRTGWASRAARREQIDLGPLSGAAALELARRLMAPAENVPATALAKLVERTHGIPLLMVELVRGLKRDGLVHRSEKTGVWFLAADELDRLPDLPLVEWLASRETEALPPNLMAHARLASVLGAELTAEQIEGVMQILERDGIAPETQLDAGVGVRRLVESGLLVRHRQGRVGFRHALLREAVYQTVAPAQREQIHRAAYLYYRDSPYAMSEEERLPPMAAHAARCGLRDRAADLYLELARRAERRHAYLDAERLYGATLENLTEGAADARAVAARQGRGLMRFRLGRPEDALKDFAAARADLPPAHAVDKDVELLLDESMVSDWLNDFSRAAALAAEAEALCPAAHAPLLEARVAYAKGRTLHRQEKAAEAAVLFERSAALAERLGGDGYETMIQSRNLLGWQYAIVGRHEDSERTFAGNVEICEAAGDMFNMTSVLQNRGILSLLSKRTDRLIEDYRRLLAICRENGFTLAEILVQKDVGEVFLMAGDLLEAERHARSAIEVIRRMVGERSRATMACELLLARVLIYLGLLDDAHALSASIRERQLQARAEGLTEGDFGPTDELLHEMIDLAAGPPPATASWEALLARARTAVQQPQDTVEMLEVWGLTELRHGHIAEAAVRLREALELSERNADAVTRRVRGHLEEAEAAAALAASGPPPTPPRAAAAARAH